MSHASQAYNRLAANNDRKKSAETLDCQINMKHVNNIVVDQYYFLFTYVYLIKEITEQMLVNRFWCVGIDPLNKHTWYEWVDKIKPSLQGGSLFNIEYNIDVDIKYAMLTE